MSFARSQAPPADENAAHPRELKALALAKAGPAAGNQRRVLGDVGNLVGSFPTRCNVGKENAAKQAAAAADGKVQVKSGVMTRRQSAVAAAQGLLPEPKAGEPGWGATKPRTGLSRRDLNVPAPAPPAATAKESKRRAGSSMSSLLQSRSESAVVDRKQAAPISPIPDIDKDDKSDPLAASDYVGDIITYYRRIEPLYRVAPDYMSRQVDINDKMRAILVDWLVEVHLKFKLMPETLFLTMNVIDRFLEQKPMTRKNLQLVGVTAMLIASKYEEIWAPEVRDFVYISDKAYTREQILNMEKVMLNTLRFNLTVPTPFNFLSRFLKAADVSNNKEVCTYATYLVELSMPEYVMLKYSHSMTAAAAVYVANKAFQQSQAYPYALRKHSGFDETSVRPCALALTNLHKKAEKNTLVAVYKKYCNAKYHEVAKAVKPVDLVPDVLDLTE
ncbi:TPA: hypothetical protein ACH3X2_010629 [Trebouxia sp. C0005]